MNILKTLNLGLAFFIELFMFAAFVWSAIALKAPIAARLAIGIVIPIAIIALWSYCIAPRSDHRLPTPLLEIVKFALYAIAAFLLYKAGHTSVAIGFLGISGVSLLLGIVWKQ